MSQFSADKGGLPPTHFTPAAGQTGAAAATRALKPPPQPRGGGSGGAARVKPRSSGGGGTLGLPPVDEAVPPPDESQDVGKVMLEYMNSLRFGRAQPFGIWAMRSGHALDINKDQKFFDVFDDLPKGY